MLPNSSKEPSEPDNNGASMMNSEPKKGSGLKRMMGMSTLFQPMKMEISGNPVAVVRNEEPSSSQNAEKSMNKFPKLERVTQSVADIRESLHRKKVTPIIIRREENTPGGTWTKFQASIVKKLQNIPEIPAFGEKTPPPPTQMARTPSGSMILRQTPDRLRRTGSLQKLEEAAAAVGGNTPTTHRIRTASLTRTARNTPQMEGMMTRRRSGSLPRCRTPTNEGIDDDRTPVLKRKRTSSLMKTSSQIRLEQLFSAPRPNPPSPKKKRVQQGEPPELADNNQGNGLIKKRFISTTSIMMTGTPNTPTRMMRRNKSGMMNVNLQAMLTETFTTALGKKKIDTEQVEQVKNGQKEGEEQGVSSSGATIHPISSCSQSTRFECSNQLFSNYDGQTNDVVATKKTKMVPLVKKQMSIEEKLKDEEEEEDEGFGDSTKTIKRGQGGALARSVSLKLSPRNEPEKLNNANTEKSCSTPSLPTAPLLRQGSTSSLRFRVSPSQYFAKPSPIVPPPPPPTPKKIVVEQQQQQQQQEIVEIVAPSTSTMEDNTPMRKGVLRRVEGKYQSREENLLQGVRRRRIKFHGINVYYFNRKQGDSTVPSEGEVALDMHNEHHHQRFFTLSNGRRPQLDVEGNGGDGEDEEEELSDGEVTGPDDYDEYSSARSISPMSQKIRIKMLKRSGVKVEKTIDSVQSIRQMRQQCGCDCLDGICHPDTCQCTLDGIQCQVDDESEYPTTPCSCYQESCENPNGRIFYDPLAVKEARTRSIMNWKAAQRSAYGGSPTIKKFTDEDDGRPAVSPWLLKNAIPIQKLDESPARYPVTPIYTRRSRSNLSDIRESCSEQSQSSAAPTPTTLSERMRTIESLENDACVEEDEMEEEMEQERQAADETITASATTTTTVGSDDITLTKINLESESNDSIIDDDNDDNNDDDGNDMISVNNGPIPMTANIF